MNYNENLLIKPADKKTGPCHNRHTRVILSRRHYFKQRIWFWREKEKITFSHKITSIKHFEQNALSVARTVIKMVFATPTRPSERGPYFAHHEQPPFLFAPPPARPYDGLENLQSSVMRACLSARVDCGAQGVCSVDTSGRVGCRCQDEEHFVYGGQSCSRRGEVLSLPSDYIIGLSMGVIGSLLFALISIIADSYFGCRKKLCLRKNRNSTIYNNTRAQDNNQTDTLTSSNDENILRTDEISIQGQNNDVVNSGTDPPLVGTPPRLHRIVASATARLCHLPRFCSENNQPVSAARSQASLLCEDTLSQLSDRYYNHCNQRTPTVDYTRTRGADDCRVPCSYRPQSNTYRVLLMGSLGPEPVFLYEPWRDSQNLETSSCNSSLAWSQDVTEPGSTDSDGSQPELYRTFSDAQNHVDGVYENKCEGYSDSSSSDTLVESDFPDCYRHNLSDGPRYEDSDSDTTLVYDIGEDRMTQWSYDTGCVDQSQYSDRQNDADTESSVATDFSAKTDQSKCSFKFKYSNGECDLASAHDIYYEGTVSANVDTDNLRPECNSNNEDILPCDFNNMPDSVSSANGVTATCDVNRTLDSLSNSKFRTESVIGVNVKPDSLSSVHLKPDSVSSTHFKPDSLSNVHLKPNSVSSTHFKPDSMSSTHFKPDSLSSVNLKPDSMSSSHLKPNSERNPNNTFASVNDYDSDSDREKMPPMRKDYASTDRQNYLSLLYCERQQLSNEELTPPTLFTHASARTCPVATSVLPSVDLAHRPPSTRNSCENVIGVGLQTNLFTSAVSLDEMSREMKLKARLQTAQTAFLTTNEAEFFSDAKSSECLTHEIASMHGAKSGEHDLQRREARPSFSRLTALGRTPKHAHSLSESRKHEEVKASAYLPCAKDSLNPKPEILTSPTFQNQGSESCCVDLQGQDYNDINCTHL